MLPTVSPSVHLSNYKIYSGKLDDIDLDVALKQSSPIIINTINPHSYATAQKDSLFQKALSNSAILLPDGIGIVYAAKFLKKEKLARITGSDLHDFLVKEANTRKLKVYYLGSSAETLEKINIKLKQEAPNVTVATYSPPFKDQFSAPENTAMIASINAFHPDILFIGMTAPKQEKWAYENQKQINAKVICSIGAVFDFYAETKKRSNGFWIKLGLEWLPRLIREPRRLWRRIFVSGPVFILDVLKKNLSR